MGTIMLGVVILLVAVVVRSAGAGLRSSGGKASGALVQLVSLGLLGFAVDRMFRWSIYTFAGKYSPAT